MPYPRGPSIVCAVAFQPIFLKNDTIDLELTFLATRMTAEGSGLALWLIYHALISLTSMNIDKVYVQSCSEKGKERTLEFYHKLGNHSFRIFSA